MRERKHGDAPASIAGSHEHSARCSVVSALALRRTPASSPGHPGFALAPRVRDRRLASQTGAIEWCACSRISSGDDHIDLSLRVTVQVETVVGAVVRRNDGYRCRLANSVVRKPISEAQGRTRLCPAAAHDRRQAGEKKRAHPNESRHSVTRLYLSRRSRPPEDRERETAISSRPGETATSGRRTEPRHTKKYICAWASRVVAATSAPDALPGRPTTARHHSRPVRLGRPGRLQ